MNTIAGNILFQGIIEFDKIGLNYIFNKVKNDYHLIYIYGTKNFDSSKEILEYFQTIIHGEIIKYDISISTEDKIQLFNKKFKGEYQLTTLSGENINFKKTIQKYQNKNNLISIREAEKNEIYGNRNIKIDYII